MSGLAIGCALVSIWVSPVAEAGEKYVLAAKESSLQFHGVASLHSFDAKIAGVTAEADWNGEWTKSTGRLTVPVLQIDTGVGGRNTKMLELLESVKFPKIDFRITGVQQLENKTSDGRVIDDLANGEIKCAMQGQLVVRGQERAVRGTGTCRKSADALLLEGSVPVDMTAFGIKPPQVAFISMDPVVTVSYRLRFGRAGSVSGTTSH